MGIKHLWSILGPYYERKPLFELQGKTVAVDLSCWICEAQNIAEYQVQPRMYLRNLYFRTAYLLLMDVYPVFVLEGKAPELKYETIAARNAIQFKGAKPKTENTKTGKGRSRFHFVLKQCEEMLKYLGLVCITGEGEAESLCAYLNEDGLVDGCISQDSDCFAYGAQIVYRNFSISQQGAHASSGGAVDVYDIRKVDKSLDFGRNKLVAMALILGSDYSEGVHGIGKDSIVKFFENVSDAEVLDRLRQWRTNEELYKKHEEKINDKNICTSCGHHGKVQGHTRNGCNSCRTNKGCDTAYKEERQIIKNEVNMRSKAILDPEFPKEALITEFLTKKDNVSKLDITWKQPNLVKFVQFALKFLGWEEIYSVEKILPILTRWQVKNADSIKSHEHLKGVLVPDRIKKVRNPKGIPSYEIIWSDPHDYFKYLIPEAQLQNQDLEKIWSTIEPQNLVEKAYPELVEAYQQSKIKPKKVSKRKPKVTVDELGELLKNTSLEIKAKKPRKPKVKLDNKNNKLENYFKNAEKCQSTPLKPMKASTLEFSFDKSLEIIENQLKNTSISKNTNITSKNYHKQAMMNNHVIKNNQSTSGKSKMTTHDFSFDMDMSRFGDEDDLDISDIVDDIIKKKTDILKDIDFDNIYLDDDFDEKKNNSFFAANILDEEDIFEKTFNLLTNDKSDTDDSDLEVLSDIENVENKNDVNDDNDSFCDIYVPLYERIKMKNK